MGDLLIHPSHMHHPSFHPSICLSIPPSLPPSRIHPSTHPSIHPSTHHPPSTLHPSIVPSLSSSLPPSCIHHLFILPLQEPGCPGFKSRLQTMTFAVWSPPCEPLWKRVMDRQLTVDRQEGGGSDGERAVGAHISVDLPPLFP